jgi:hypothetical protein
MDGVGGAGGGGGGGHSSGGSVQVEGATCGNRAQRESAKRKRAKQDRAKEEWAKWDSAMHARVDRRAQWSMLNLACTLEAAHVVIRQFVQPAHSRSGAPT